MRIAGIQKLSMVDFPGKLACVIFTGGCDLRCPYCHNSELLENPPIVMEEEELFDFLKSRKGKLDGICVSGGEPCIQKDLIPFMERLRNMGLLIKLDTNGSHPQVLEEVLRRGLADYVAMDIKNNPPGYPEITGRADYEIEPLRQALILLLDSAIDFELRTTVVKPFHDRTSFLGIRDFLMPETEKYRKVPWYYLQSFQDRDTVPFAGFLPPKEEELKEYAQILQEVSRQVVIR